MKYSNDGTPLVCECGSKEFESCNYSYNETIVVEYDCKCSKCGKILNHWKYGYWEYISDNNKN